MNIIQILIMCTLITSTNHLVAMKHTHVAIMNNADSTLMACPDELITKIAAQSSPTTRNALMYVSKKLYPLASRINSAILYEPELNLNQEDTHYYLLQACTNNEQGILKNLLSSNCPDYNEKNKRFALYRAIEANNSRSIAFLLDLLGKRHYKKTALFYSIQKRCVNALQTILADKEVDVNEKDHFGNTPLHYAAGKPYVARRLDFSLSTFTEINQHFNHKRDIMLKNTAMVEALLKHNDIKVDIQDNSGKTPLHYADQIPYIDIWDMLRKAQ